MKKENPCKKPCQCDTCEKARWLWPCSDGEHPSFFNTVTSSPEWALWQKEQSRRFSIFAKGTNKKENAIGVYDMPEVEECNHISPEHWEEFIKFITIEKNK